MFPHETNRKSLFLSRFGNDLELRAIFIVLLSDYSATLLI